MKWRKGKSGSNGLDERVAGRESADLPLTLKRNARQPQRTLRHARCRDEHTHKQYNCIS